MYFFFSIHLEIVTYIFIGLNYQEKKQHPSSPKNSLYLY